MQELLSSTWTQQLSGVLVGDCPPRFGSFPRSAALMIIPILNGRRFWVVKHFRHDGFMFINGSAFVRHLVGKANGAGALAVGKFLELKNAPFNDLISALNLLISLSLVFDCLFFNESSS